jgi:IS5 family transposase
MREKYDNQLYLEFSGNATLKVVKEYREKYKSISKILDKNPKILSIVHTDIKHANKSSNKGRKSTYTTENIVRALITHNIEGTDWRETIVRVSESGFLKDFIRFGNRPVMDYSFLCKCFKAIRPETWQKVNKSLGIYAINNNQLDPKELRVDTTVVESNIHYPTDASLLWDGYRVIKRNLVRARERNVSVCPHRFHDKKVKGHYLFITRYISSKSKSRKRRVTRRFLDLIHSVERVVSIAEEFCLFAQESGDIVLAVIESETRFYLKAVKKVVAVTKRVVIDGEKVPASERVFSVFEQHVELIKRGKRGKEVEFGHKVLICQTKDKFITDYDAMEEQRPDNKHVEGILERHKKQFGKYPEVLAGDKGFRSELKDMQKQEKKVSVLAIPKRATDWGNDLLQPWQGFRAGIEGSISVLKRAFRLVRCHYRGFKSFAASIGMGVFCHNLVKLANTS